jgi:hypothetical protein
MAFMLIPPTALYADFRLFRNRLRAGIRLHAPGLNFWVLDGRHGQAGAALPV